MDKTIARFFDDDALKRAQELNDKYKQIITCLSDGARPVEIPWGDALFQTMLLRFIEELRHYKYEAEKLAVIREVFGGR